MRTGTDGTVIGIILICAGLLTMVAVDQVWPLVTGLLLALAVGFPRRPPRSTDRPSDSYREGW